MTETPHTLDVRAFIDSRPFSPYQWLIFAMCFLIVAADGYDTAAIGFIAPSLVQEWGIARSALGPVLSAALAGLGFGALIAGPIADRVGRKAVLVLSVAFFGIWSLAATRASSIESMTAMRFLTGLGLGAAMPNAVTAISEYAPARARALAVNAMFCGFSGGLAAGGALAAWLIPHCGWRSVLVVGGLGPCVLALLLILLLPESIQFLAVRGNQDERIARILMRIAPHESTVGRAFVLRDVGGGTAVGGRAALALVTSRSYRFGTAILWLTYFMGLVIFYLLTNWLPTLFKEAGFTVAEGALMTSLFPLGGVLGNLCAGWFMDRFDHNRTISAIYALVAVLVVLVGRSVDNFVLLGVLMFATGTMATSALSSMCAYAANFYPTEGRATGVAWMLGIGRLGGVAGAFTGAAVMGLDWKFGAIFGLLAVPALASVVALRVLAWRVSTTKEQNDDVRVFPLR